jgi:hypothetical protein
VKNKQLRKAVGRTRLHLIVHPGREVIRLRDATAHELATGHHHQGKVAFAKTIIGHGAFNRAPGEMLVNKGFDYAGYHAERRRLEAQAEQAARPGLSLLSRVGSKLAGALQIRPKVKLKLAGAR